MEKQLDNLSHYPELLVVKAQREKEVGLYNDLLLSDFLFSQYQRHAEWFENTDLKTSLCKSIKKATTLAELKSSLRHFRNYCMVQLTRQELADEKNTLKVMGACSELADECVQLALEWLEIDLEKQLGTPKNEQGQRQKLVVIGMGKLGGRELNLSSDIDLIFTFPEAGCTEGARRSVDNVVFFNRLVQQLIGVLSEFNQDGFVFRVDSRLRPFGDSGPLVASFDTLEDYYLDQGRGWERFAMIKARPITGDPEQTAKLINILQPFVYKRYIDFSMLETPRKIKLQIEAELRRRKLGENLKLGPGGIREIEFIVQAMQLIHGGKLRSLQHTSTLEVLKELATHQLLSVDDCDSLRNSYMALRHWEHCLQGFKDQQTQTLPADEVNRERLCYLAGKKDWQQWLLMLEDIRKPVHRIFLNQFGDEGREQRLTASNELQDLWLVPEQSVENIKLLESLGYKDTDKILDLIIQFKIRLHQRTNRMSARAEEMIAKLVPEVIRLSAKVGSQFDSVDRMFALLESVVTRTAYLDLFVENKKTLFLLVELFSRSPWIAQHTRQFPLVLDDLLNPKWLQGEEIDDRGHLLTQQLARIPEDDEEQLLDLFREFKQSSYFQLAACFTTETLGIQKLGEYLSNIAGTLVTEAYRLSKGKVEKRFGQLLHKDGSEAEFIVVAMGKLGSYEMGFSSDLDLVFIHDGCEGLSRGNSSSVNREIDGFQFFAKLAQRLIHALSIRMSSGVLYEIDTRLRPSGNSGYLVSSMDEYQQYQLEDAWTWEHQALIRARVVSGSKKLTKKFNQVRATILRMPRDKDNLRQDVSKMRLKMKQKFNASEKALWDPKQADGGLTDIEFLIQYLVLSNASGCEVLTANTSMVAQLKILADYGFLEAAESKTLRKIYLLYHEHINRQTLLQKPIVTTEKFNTERQQVIDILQKYNLWPWKHPS